MRVAIFGAGIVGCYLGGRLQAGGQPVAFIGRPRIGEELLAHGLRLTDLRGTDLCVPASAIAFDTNPDAAADADLVLVTVKAGATAETGAILAPICRLDAVIVSFQNGIGNEEILRPLLPGRTVLAGMVPFNVVHRPGGHFHQATQGGLDIERHAALAPFRAAFEKAGLPLTEHEGFRPVQWGKLLLNLNNAISGLSGLTLREELSQRAYRRCLALVQREALAALRAAGISPERMTALPPRFVPAVLGLPDWLFLRLAGRMMAIDAAARSSMIDALDEGRPTDVDWLNGEVVRLAEQVGREAPANRRVVELVHAAEGGSRRRWSGPELLRELRSAR